MALNRTPLIEWLATVAVPFVNEHWRCAHCNRRTPAPCQSPADAAKCIHGEWISDQP